MSKYSNLWAALRRTLCKHHDLDEDFFNEGYADTYPVRKKAYFLFLLEVALFEYQKNEIGIWLQQSPGKTLNWFVYSKTGMLPEQFDKLSSNEKLMVLHKPLIETQLPEAAQSYLKNLLEPAVSDNFEIDPFEGWIPGTGWPLLRRE